ncbi:hypothetical protein EOM09_01715 [bacterium]|nr:hypothetical protein [bacterium]
MRKTEINEENAIITAKLLNREFDIELNDLLTSYMKENTILGMLARLNNKIHSHCKINNYEYSDNDDSLVWQFNGENDEW